MFNLLKVPVKTGKKILVSLKLLYQAEEGVKLKYCQVFIVFSEEHKERMQNHCGR